MPCSTRTRSRTAERAGKSKKPAHAARDDGKGRPPGPEQSVADTTAAWDARYREWVVPALNCTYGSSGVTVSISKDSTHWSKPIRVLGPRAGIIDKDWVTCDSHPASPTTGTATPNGTWSTKVWSR